MEGSVEFVADIEWPSRKGRCHTDSNYPKYSRDQSKTSAQNLPNVNNIPGDLTERTVECILTALEVPRKNTT